MVATKLTTKGQVVIPKPLRTKLGWRAGARLSVEPLPGAAVRLSLIAEDPIARAFGFLPGGDPLTELEAEHAAEVAADERRQRRR